MNPILSHALIGVSTLIIGICVGYSIREQNKFNSQLVMNFGVAIISICALSGLLVSINSYRAATTCQSKYNSAFTSTLKERQDATNSDRDALRTLVDGTITSLDTILNPASDIPARTKAVQDYRTAFQNYRKTLGESDQKRASNPIPGIPECAEGF